MTLLKKILRIAGLIILITLACMGVGFGPFLPNKERFMDNEIRTEQADKKTEEEEEDEVKN